MEERGGGGADGTVDGGVGREDGLIVFCAQWNLLASLD